MNKKFFLGLFSLLIGSVFFANTVMAADCSTYTDGTTCAADGCYWVEGTCVDEEPGFAIEIPKVAGSNRSFADIIGAIINALFAIIGPIAVLIILYGGFQWMTAGGDEAKVSKAKATLKTGIIGLAIILSAWSIVLFVIDIIYA